MSTLIKISASTTSQQLLPERSLGRRVLLFNNSLGVMYVAIDNEASTDLFTVRVLPNAFIELPIFGGSVHGVWAQSTSGNVMITELP